jgi:3',5'-cyclic AMP phosphodiesterase CpdA
VSYQRKNFKWTDTFIPDDQRAWLKDRLAEAPKHVLVMVHQRLDGLDLNHGVLNHAAVREILAASGKVRAVLAGHSHKNALNTVDGMPFLVARAIVDDPGPDNNAYGLVELFADGGVRVRGYGKQVSAELKG